MFFFVTGYRDIGAWFAGLLAGHDDVACSWRNELLDRDGRPERSLADADELTNWMFDHTRGRAVRYHGNVGGFTAARLLARLPPRVSGQFSVRTVNLTMHPVRRIDGLWKQFDRHEIDAPPFVDVEHEGLEELSGYLALGAEFAGRPLSKSETRFVRAAFDSCNDLVDFSCPVFHCPVERLSQDQDFLVHVLRDLTANSIDLDPEFMARSRSAMSEASAEFKISCNEIVEEWTSWQREFIRRVVQTRNADQIYNEFGYDLSMFTTRTDKSIRFLTYSAPPGRRFNLHLRESYPPVEVEHGFATPHLGQIRRVAADKPQTPLHGLRHRVVKAAVDGGDLRPAGILVSIHMQSNRPTNIIRFLDEIEAMTADPTRVEVIVKIDDTDEAMNALMPREVSRRKVRLKFISTSSPRGFYGLWESMNDMLKVTDPTAYFLLNLNDEMYFETKHWDNVLAQYRGAFPDDIFRIRTSPERFRNYHDHWEAGFANDTSAFITKRWIEIGGNWCPCNGPDSFQQCVSFYLSYNDRFAHPRPDRDLVANDIQISGHGANRGVSGARLRRRIQEGLPIWWILMSHKMQQEASRRAGALDAEIFAFDVGLKNYVVKDRRWIRRVDVVNADTGETVRRYWYGLSWWRMAVQRLVRTVHFQYYAGGGFQVGRRPIRNIWFYLYHRFEFCAQIMMAIEDARPQKLRAGPRVMGPIIEESRFKTLAWVIRHFVFMPRRAIRRPSRAWVVRQAGRLRTVLRNPALAIRVVMRRVGAQP